MTSDGHSQYGWRVKFGFALFVVSIGWPLLIPILPLLGASTTCLVKKLGRRGSSGELPGCDAQWSEFSADSLDGAVSLSEQARLTFRSLQVTLSMSDSTTRPPSIRNHRATRHHGSSNVASRPVAHGNALVPYPAPVRRPAR